MSVSNKLKNDTTNNTLLLLSNLSHSVQTIDRIEENFKNEITYKSDNIINYYKSSEFNFAEIWTNTENQRILGVIGDERARNSNQIDFSVFGFQITLFSIMFMENQK